MAHYSGEQEQGEYELHNSKEIVAGNMNVASRVCKGKLRVGQCQSDPGITQINA